MPRTSRIDLEDTIRLVRERLEFVQIISDLNPQFLDHGLIRHMPDGGWTHPWIYFDSLRNYLLLTCFDLLGQPSEYKDFQSWLASSATASERAAVIASMDQATGPIDAAASLYRSYLDSYGSRQSFFRFINSVIPDATREQLLHSIMIRQIDPAKNLEIAKVESSDEKIKFLFGIRNIYTHQAKNTGSPSAGVFPNWNEWRVINGVPMKGYEPIKFVKRSAERIDYCVRDWPDVLVRTVNTGIDVVERGSVD